MQSGNGSFSFRPVDVESIAHSGHQSGKRMGNAIGEGISLAAKGATIVGVGGTAALVSAATAVADKLPETFNMVHESFKNASWFSNENENADNANFDTEEAASLDTLNDLINNAEAAALNGNTELLSELTGDIADQFDSMKDVLADTDMLDSVIDKIEGSLDKIEDMDDDTLEDMKKMIEELIASIKEMFTKNEDSADMS